MLSRFGLTHILAWMFELATLDAPAFASVEWPTRNAIIALQSSDIGLVNDQVSEVDWPPCELVNLVTVPNAGFALALVVANVPEIVL